MERRFHLVKAGTPLKDARVDDADDDLRAIVVEREGRPAGLAPPRSGLWREARSGALIGRFVERPPAICRDSDLLSLIPARLKRHRAGRSDRF